MNRLRLYLNQEIEYSKWNNSNNENGCGHNNYNKRIDDSEKGEEKGAKRPWNDLIDNVDVF